MLNVFQEFEAPDEGEHVLSDEFYNEDDFPDSVDVVTSVLEEDGIAVEWRREHGDAEDEILRVAEEIDAGSTVMSGRRRSPTGKVLFGSITQYVLLNVEQPAIGHDGRWECHATVILLTVTMGDSVTATIDDVVTDDPLLQRSPNGVVPRHR